jgi:flavin reductase (DIM6/NTAB) family NADH-FMN oxidoreductase RutF
MTIDPREFRNTVGCFATGITIITTIDEDGGPVGFTANSFSSVSLDPPLVLFCLDRRVASFDAFHEDRSFAVNILSAEQGDLSQRFATSGPDKWNGVAFDSWDRGCPIFSGCLANFECDIHSIYEGGDHVVVIGEVVRMASAEEAPKPLLYYRGGYAGIGEG